MVLMAKECLYWFEFARIVWSFSEFACLVRVLLDLILISSAATATAPDKRFVEEGQPQDLPSSLQRVPISGPISREFPLTCDVTNLIKKLIQ